MHLFRNGAKAKLVYQIGSYLLDRFSSFKMHDELTLVQNAKFQLEEIFRILYDEIAVLADKFDELATLKFTD
jgi:hypothetical protein